MMNFKLRTEQPDPSRALISAGVMGMSYFLGGIMPMIPYFAVKNVNTALFISIVITIIILLIFGYTKSIITGTGQKSALISAAQTLAVGAVAAGASYGIVRGVDASLGGGGVEGH
jgi:predicted membrane protein (TIGR00267 family)